ncbi:MAG: hypothetical protein NXH85_03500 [Pseudomonadaceae bacterium]|nr:hypothetical protein [Pseudomonadaceae bacterium]
MAALKLWLAERQQVVLTRIANRSFKQNPGWLDRLALRLIERAAGPVGEADPELEHH